MLVRHFILSLTDDKLEIDSTPCTKLQLHNLWVLSPASHYAVSGSETGRNRSIVYYGERRSDASNQPHSSNVNLSQSSHFEPGPRSAANAHSKAADELNGQCLLNLE